MGFLKNLWHYEPVVLAWALNGGLAAFLAFVVHLSSTQEASVTTILTAIVAIYTAVKTRPVAVTVITGAVATVAVAAGAFGLHLQANTIGAVTVILGAVLALVLRQNVTPAAALSPHMPPTALAKAVPVEPVALPTDPPVAA
jgi:hypothetical protein